ncbi:MAG: hypothetical protein R3178_11450, partial [Rhodothermales bacterium]|nr:hypothetical protein [Rhodothermales bacterium]
VAVVGRYPAHVDVAFLQSSKWLFGAVFPATHPNDVAYAILNLSTRGDIDPSDIGRVYLYGEVMGEDEKQSLRSVVAPDVERMNPLHVIQGGPTEEREDFDPGDYVLCLGATL